MRLGVAPTLHDVTRFGAATFRDSTAAITAAIAAARSGDTVLVPAGVFLTRPINISTSGLVLRVDGTLRCVTGSIDEWPLLPPLPTYGRDRDGAKPRRHQPLIMLHGVHGVVVKGRGTIDGQGRWWWDARRTQPHAGRPHLIEVHSCAHVEIADLTLIDSPFWTVHLYASQAVHVHDITVRVHARPRPELPPSRVGVYEGMAPLYAPNTDGIDPDSCRHVLIERCDISCGDDHVAIKSGMNAVARDRFPEFVTENGAPQENTGMPPLRRRSCPDGRALDALCGAVTVRHNTFRSGMGVSIGSETAGGIRDVHVHHNTFLGDGGWCVALHLKSAARRGGVVERVSFAHNIVHNTTALMRLGTFGKREPSINQAELGYEPTTIRDVEWVHNVYTPTDGGRHLRSRFQCPSRGRCARIALANNSLPPSASWQCTDVLLRDNAAELQTGLTKRGGCISSAAAVEERQAKPQKSYARGRPGRSKRRSRQGRWARESAVTRHAHEL